MPHPLAHHRLPGIGPMRQARLEEAGIRTLEQLLETPLDELAELPGFHGAIARRAHAAALTVLESIPAASPELVELDEEPPDDRTAGGEPDETSEPIPEDERIDPSLKRGLEIARRIEETRGWVRTVRARLKGPKKTRRSKKSRKKRPPMHFERKMLRRELKRLAKTLGKVQREAITDGLSVSAADDLDALLAKIERRLEKFTGRPLDVDRVVKLAGRMTRAQRALRLRIT